MITEGVRPPLGKCYGSTSVGSHGQTVIPVEARRELDIDIGDKLMAFNFFQDKALLLIKTSDFEQLITMISSRVSELEAIASQITKMAAKTSGGSN